MYVSTTFLNESKPISSKLISLIEGYVDSRNIACKKAIEKMGFIFEGSMRDCEIKDNQFLSVDIYSKLKTD